MNLGFDKAYMREESLCYCCPFLEKCLMIGQREKLNLRIGDTVCDYLLKWPCDGIRLVMEGCERSGCERLIDCFKQLRDDCQWGFLTKEEMAEALRLDCPNVSPSAWRAEKGREMMMETEKELKEAEGQEVKNCIPPYLLHPGIERAIFRDPATIVFWEDGVKTVVRCQDGDAYSPEVGLAMCVCKRFFGNSGRYNDEFRRVMEGAGLHRHVQDNREEPDGAEDHD